MQIGPRRYSRTQLLDVVGDIDQLGGVTSQILTDGGGAGSRTLTVQSPGGLSFVCLPDRGLDIGWAEHGGVPLAWRSPVGDLGPTYAERDGAGWLRTFGGGLVTTCGLSTVGQPSVDAGESLGLHGRYSTTPAREVTWATDWSGDERVVTIHGRVREAVAVGPVLELRRTISHTLGSGALRIDDVVTNLGAAPAPHMFRYHVNLGFPLVDPTSCIDVGDDELGSSSDRPDLPGWRLIGPPLPPVTEQVITVAPAGQGPTATATLVNPRGRPSLRLTWSRAPLPLLLVWKQPSRRSYVTALEPSNCHDNGRAAERNRGTLLELQPDEQRHYQLDLTVLASPAGTDTGES